MRRIFKQMKEAQEFGQLLNQRQKLFGVAVVPFDNLNKLIKEFEPYKNLWVTGSGIRFSLIMHIFMFGNNNVNKIITFYLRLVESA